MDESAPYLSIVIPAYNEAERLRAHFDEVVDFVNNFEKSCEVVVVENGSTDNTAEVVLSYQDKIPSLRLFRETKRGKGLAVRRGMLESRGQYRFMCDVDLSMPLSELPKFLPPNLGEADIAIGNRVSQGSEVECSRSRIFIRKVFNWIVQRSILPKIDDVLCGFKCLRAEVAQDIFSECIIDGISFDIEFLYLAEKKGYTVTEVPIIWRLNADSRVSFFSDTPKTLRDIRLIKKHHAN